MDKRENHVPCVGFCCVGGLGESIRSRRGRYGPDHPNDACRTAQRFALPAGTWQVLVQDDTAGTEPLAVVSGTATVHPVSTTVLVK